MTTSILLEADVPANPIALFSQWYLAAEKAELPEPSAMTLATADAVGVPNARMVLMRGFDERGFVFYTNYQSQKAAELLENPRAALVFHWAPMQRQVRVQGRVERVSAEESDAYFRTRPFGHQLGALISPQSQVIADRGFLEESMAYCGSNMTRPTRCPVRRTGEDIAAWRRSSNSGKGDPTGCMIGCATAAWRAAG